MRKVFAVLAVLLVVGCADVGEDVDGLELEANGKGKARTADAGQVVEIVAPYDDEPELELPVVADAALIPAPKTGSDAGVAPVLPVADAGSMTDEPQPEPVVEQPVVAPAPQHFLDGRTLHVSGLRRHREFTLHFVTPTRATVTVTDPASGAVLGTGTGTVRDNYGVVSGVNAQTMYSFTCEFFVNEQAGTVVQDARSVVESVGDWKEPRIFLLAR